MWLFLGCHSRCYRVPSSTTLFIILFMFVEVDLHTVGLGTKVVETLESLGHRSSQDIVPKVVKGTCAPTFCCMKFFGHTKVCPNTLR